MKTVACSFREILAGLIERIVRDHPYHTIYVLYALANAQLDSQFVSGNGCKSASRIKKDQKGLAATNIMDQLKRKDAHLKQVIEDVEKLSAAYIELAWLNVGNAQKNQRSNFDGKIFANAQDKELDPCARPNV